MAVQQINYLPDVGFFPKLADRDHIRHVKLSPCLLPRLFGLVSCLFGSLPRMGLGGGAVHRPVRFPICPLSGFGLPGGQHRLTDGHPRSCHGQEQEQQAHRGAQRCHHRLSLAPPPTSLHGADRPSQDRFTAEEPLELVDQFLSRRIPSMALFSQTLEADRLQILGELGVYLHRRDGLLFQHLHQRVQRIVRLKRRAASQARVEDRAE